MTKIDVGDGLSMVPGKWEFDGIESTFDQHVIRSVPMYEESHYMVIRLAEYFLMLLRFLMLDAPQEHSWEL